MSLNVTIRKNAELTPSKTCAIRTVREVNTTTAAKSNHIALGVTVFVVVFCAALAGAVLGLF